MSSKSALSLVACGLAAAMMVSILASPAHADCVLDWSFNGNTNDSINGYNGTFYGGTATYGAGPLGVGQCINLTSAECVYNYSTTMNNLPLAGTSPWTENIWLDLPSGNIGGGYYTWMDGFASSAGNSGYYSARVMASYGNDIYFWASAADRATSVAYLTDSAWHMYTFTYSGGATGTLDIYLDGSFQATATDSLGQAVSCLQVGAAGSIWGTHWSGSAADYTVWNNCLTAGQVGYLASNPAATTTPTAAINGLQWTGAVNGDWSTNPSSLNWSATAGGAPSLSYSDNQSVLLDDSGSANTTISVSAANVAPASVTFNNNAYNYKLTGAYGITGTATLTLNGSGMVTLSNSNTYSGATTINAGTLVIGAAAGASPNSTFTLNANNGLAFGTGVTSGTLGGLAGSGNLALTSSDSLNVALAVGANGQNATYTGILSGGGSLVKIGTGVQSLGGLNTYSGATTVANGTLRLLTPSLLVNGNFAAPALAATTQLYYSAMSSAQQQSLVWVGAGDASLENQFVGTVGWTVPPGGGQAMQIQDLGSVTQVVNVPAAGNYQLTWGAEGATGSGIYKNTLEVLLDSTQVGGAFIAPASTWTSYDYSMYMTAGTHTIEFEGTAANTAALTALANVALTGSGGPLPTGAVVTVAGQTSTGGPAGILDLAGLNQTVAGLTGGGTSGSGTTFGTVTNNGTSGSVLTVTGASQFDGVLADGTSKLGLTVSGSLMLTGPNTYTGPTTVNAGTLAVNGSLAAAGSVWVSNATLTGTGSVGSVLVNGGGTLAVGNGVNTMSAAALTLTSTATSFLNIYTAAGYNPLAVSGAVTLPGSGVTLDLTGGSLALGTYHLMSYGSISGLVPSTFTIANSPPPGEIFAVQTDPGNYLDLLISGGVINGVWATNGPGTWGGTANWTAGGVPGSGLDTAVFGAVLTSGTAAVTLDSSRSLSSLGFSTTGGNSYVITPSGASTLTLANTLTSTATLSNSGGNHTINAPIILGSNLSVTATTGSVLAIGGPISETGGSQTLSLGGGGLLALSGNNTYSGSTAVNAGTLQIGGAGVLGGGNYAGAISVASSAAMVANTTSSQTFSGGIIDNGAIVVNSSGNQTFSYISGGTGSFTQEGSGTVFLNGIYSLATGGSTTVSGGMLVANTILGQSSVLVTSGGTLVANTDAFSTYVPLLTLQGGLVTTGTNGSYHTTVPNIVFNGGGTIASGAGNTGDSYGNYNQYGGLVGVTNPGATTAIISAGTFNLYQSTTFNVARGTSPSDLTVSGAINGFNGYGNYSGLTLTGGGIMTLTGNNTYAGSTTISAGTLVIGAAAGASPNSTFAIDANNGLAFGTGVTSGTLGGLAGPGNLALTSSDSQNVALTVGANNQNTTYSGVLSGGGSLTMAGTGLLVLSGSNTYSGNTAVNSGTLQIGNGTSGEALASNSVSVSGGAALAFNHADTLAYSGAISGNGAVVKSGTGLLSLSGNNVYAGATTINSGTLAIGASAAASPSSTFTINVNNGLAFGNGVTSGTLGGLAGNGNLALTSSDSQNVALVVGGNGQNAAYNGVLSGGGSLTKIGTGVQSLGGLNTYGGATTVANGTLRLLTPSLLANGNFAAPALAATTQLYYSAMSSAQQQSLVWVGAGDASLENQFVGTVGWTVPPGGGQAMQIQDLGSVTQVVNVPAAGNYQLTWGAEGATGSGIYKNTLEVLLDNSQVGGAFIAPASTWTSYDYSMYMTAGTHTIEFAGQAENTAALTALANVVLTGSGGPLPTGAVVTVAGQTSTGGPSGILDLAGLNQTVAGLSGGGTAGSGTTFGTVTNSGSNDSVLTVTGASEFDGVLADGATNKLGLTVSGSLTLAGPNTNTGPTTINGGTLQIGNGGSGEALASPTISNSGLLVFNHADALTYAGAISGPGSLTKAGPGVLTLAANNTYGGLTTVSGGVLSVTGTLNNSGGVSVNSGVLSGNGSITGPGYVYVFSGGTLAPGNIAGAGTLNVTNLVLGNQAVLNYTLGASAGGNAFVNCQTLAFLPPVLSPANVTLNILDSSLSTGTYALFSYTAGVTGLTSTTFAIGTAPASVAGDNFTFNDTGSVLDLIISPSGSQTINGTWATNGSGTWSTSGNWSGGVPGSGQDTAVFGTALTSGTATVTLDGSRSLASLGFSTTGGNSYVIAASGASTLTLANTLTSTAALSNSGGNHTINAPIVLGSNLSVSATTGSALTIAGGISESSTGTSVSVSGGGDLILSGTDTYTGGTNVSAATLAITSASALSSTGVVTLSGGGQLVLGSGSGIGALLGASAPIGSGAVALSAAASVPATLAPIGNSFENMATLGGAPSLSQGGGGSAVGGSAAAAPVPEPTSLALAAVAIIALAVWRRGKSLGTRSY